MHYLNTLTMEYPLCIGDIQLAHPGVREEGDNIPPEYVPIIIENFYGTIDEETQIIEKQPIILENDEWKIKYTVRDMTAEEKEDYAKWLEIEKSMEPIKPKNPLYENLDNSGSAPNVIA